MIYHFNNYFNFDKTIFSFSMKLIERAQFTLYPVMLLCLTGYFFIQCSPEPDDPQPGLVTPETALDMYINNGDKTYGWEIKNTYTVLNVRVTDLLLTSQQWQDYVWKHQLTVFAPDNIQYDKALLWITGGSLENSSPKWASVIDAEALVFGTLASENEAVTVVLRQIPNQPLLDGHSEDALIAKTLQNFINDGDYSWPLLFPMVKSTVRAMDAVQELLRDEENMEISGFVISGASKRGWTTWLAGAADSRVTAIAPAVIDMLNMPVNLDYQVDVWGEYSEQIQDYVDLGIPQDVHSQQGSDITLMIDPYSYRDKLTMPKMIFIGTNDRYWPVDAVKHYIADIPGENYIHYVANAGHDLGGGEQAIEGLRAFFLNTAAGQPYPECSWETTESATGITLNVSGSLNALKSSYLWTATSADRDFRNEEWSSDVLEIIDNSRVNVFLDYPDTGFAAFYIDLEYTDIRQRNYTVSTRMFVIDEDEIL